MHTSRAAAFAGAVLLAVAGCSREAERLPGGVVSRPLAARAPGAAPTQRFRLVPPATSGLAFQNELRPENRYTYLTNGAGLAVGDYDGDGKKDVYLISQDGPNRLFRQTAPLVFEDVTAAAGGVDGGAAWGTGACFADIDGDGDLDLYVCNMEAPNRLYENRGDGTFVENGAKFGLDISAASTMCAFADYDRDGKLDLYLLTNRALHAGWTNTPEVLAGMRPPTDTARPVTAMVPTQRQWQRINALASAGRLQHDRDVPEDLREHFLAFRGRRYTAGQPDRLLRQVGGRFVDVTTSAGIEDRGMGLSATWFDYDQDGWPDLYVANDLESPDTLYHNQRDGTFRDVTRDAVPHTAYYGMGSDFADVDGDGTFDLLVADMSMTTHEKAKVLMGDMDEERPVLMHWQPPQMMRNALLLNTGLGRFQEAAKLAGVASTDWTWAVRFEDLDLDGKVDLFCSNGIARFDTDPDLKLRVDALWREGRQQAAIDLIQNVGKVPEKNLAFRNVSGAAPRFEKTGAAWGLDLEAVSHGAVLCDLDGDGDVDVITNDFESPASLFENRSSAGDGHAILVRLIGQHSERHGVGATVRATTTAGSQVRELSLSRGYLAGHPPELHFGIGAARSVDLEVHWPSGHRQRFTGLAADHLHTITEPGDPPPDLPASPRADSTQLFEAAAAPPFTHRENEFDEFRDQPLLPAAVGRLGPALAAHDGLLFVGGARGQSGALFRAEGATGWKKLPGPWEQDAAHEDLGAVFVDHDGDGDMDLVVTSGGAEVPQGDATLRDRLYRNDGEQGFVRDDAALPDEARTSSGRCRAADFDGDGDVDLLVCGRLVPGAYPDAPPSRLYRNDGGGFVDVTAAIAPALLSAGMVTDALWTDANGDGRLDLLLAARWQPLRLLHNDGAKFVDHTERAGLAASHGWWNALCEVGDVDGDGDVDYLCGNQGWNTKYKASPEHPARIYFGDFDDNGTRDLVEAKYEGDRLLPVRGRSCSSGAMPMIAEKFSTYEKFAKSLLADIYTEQKLAQCGEVFATELASCLLRNDGDGTFTLEPLPRLAQIAPIFACALAAPTADGATLVVCAQNHFSPEPETGRHDGGTGLVLRFVDGQPEVVPPIEHGICVFGDHKELVTVERASGPVLVFGRNDDALHTVRLREAR